jgi:hypothetical protein
MSRPQAQTEGQSPGPKAMSWCAEPKCLLLASTTCSYVDRAPKACGTTWCAKHHATVEEEPYCLKHAGVMRALLSAPNGVLVKPPVDNRAPSLVAWVSRDLDAGFRAVLQATCGPMDTVVVEPLKPIASASGTGQAWVRIWRGMYKNGLNLAVGLEVSEARDAEVLISVGGDTLVQQVPPWIAARRRNENVSVEIDAERRRDFYGNILSAVGLSISERLRAAANHRHGA